VTRRDPLAAFAGYLRERVDLWGIRPLKIVIDAGTGMGGHVAPAVLGDTILPALPLPILAMYFELDGTFANPEANHSIRRTWSTCRTLYGPPAPTPTLIGRRQRVAAQCVGPVGSREIRPGVTAVEFDHDVGSAGFHFW
jgi:hypothetical protein